MSFRGQAWSRLGALAVIALAVFTLLASLTMESAHAAQAAPAESHAESVITVHHDGGSEKSKVLHSGHCAAHCASHVMADPPHTDNQVPAPVGGSIWTPSPSREYAGISPALQDQPPRG